MKFTVNDIEVALQAVKNGKAAGADGILPEFIKMLGPKGKTWLAKLSTEIANTSVIPKLWREVKAIAKPGSQQMMHVIIDQYRYYQLSIRYSRDFRFEDYNL